MIGIYKITSPSGKVYIGQSMDIEIRFVNYKRLTSCKRQRRLFNSLKAHGAKSHTYEIVEECLQNLLNVRERHWQEIFDVIGKNGLNCRLTGEGDRSGFHSAESKALMSIRQAGINNPNYGKIGADNPNYGKKFSEITLRRRSIARTGKGRSILQFDKEMNFAKEARVIDFVSEGFSQSGISSCCSGRLKAHKGFIFRFKELI
jgi:group I intron endonuclease